MSLLGNRRVLLVDDMPAIHEDFRKILCPTRAATGIDALEAALFGAEPAPDKAVPFDLDSAYQGQEGLANVEKALAFDRPYALAFIDMRMPPGWDGLQTIERMWAVDPRVQMVICTAYADHSWEDLLERLDARDRLLILKKPFEAVEVRQLANSLSAKWEMTRQLKGQLAVLEHAVADRTRDITLANEALKAEIAERKQLENQLVQSEKLASIGQLAAGVAHEINNPIGYIFSNFGTLETYLARLFEMLAAYESAESRVDAPEVVAALRALRERMELDFLREDIQSLMTESRQGIVRVRQIVQDLKDFSRVDSSQEPQLANLHHGIDSTLNIVASEIKYRAEVVKEYGSIPEVECVASQINQVVMNLLVNAAHAMGDKRGRIIIRTGGADAQVWIEVADNGSGIPPETLKRIFEPFFTTKPVGQGTGLGLSLSYGIVQKHGGRIEARSVVGEGTTFRVTLPTDRGSAP
jgi:two-component system NtrC family sensor kinase